MISRSTRLIATGCLGFLLAVAPVLASRSHRVATVSHHKAGHFRHHAMAAVVSHATPGQRGIDPERTRAIQTALITKSYLSGEATGEWNADTEAAMQKFQGDNGWQTKLMPDSRALIKLGLGPNGADSVSLTASSTGSSLQQSTGADTLAAVHSIQN